MWVEVALFFPIEPLTPIVSVHGPDVQAVKKFGINLIEL